MVRKLVISLGIMAGLLVLADRGLAAVAGNATANRVARHEGLSEDPEVTFRGFPFLTQAVRGDFQAVDVTVRDLERNGLVIDRIDAHLEGVRIDLGDALGGRVGAVPVREGDATVRLTYGDLQSYLSTRPGNLRLVTKAGRVVVVTSFGIPRVGTVDVEGTPRVSVAGRTVRVTVSQMRRSDGGGGLAAALAAQAASRASFSIPLGSLPFGITAASAELTDTALLIQATAEGIVVDVAG